MWVAFMRLYVTKNHWKSRKSGRGALGSSWRVKTEKKKLHSFARAGGNPMGAVKRGGKRRVRREGRGVGGTKKDRGNFGGEEDLQGG